MPVAAIFAAATQIRFGENAAHFQPNERAHGKTRSEADIESTIAVKDGRVPAIEREPLAMGDEHRNARPIFARKEDLFGDVIVGIEIDFGGAKHLVSARLEVQ